MRACEDVSGEHQLRGGANKIYSAEFMAHLVGDARVARHGQEAKQQFNISPLIPNTKLSTGP